MNEGTYACSICKRDTPHDHGEIVQITDTDKLLRALSGAGHDFSLGCPSQGGEWIAALRRKGFIDRHDRVLVTGRHGTAHLALRALALLVDRDDHIPDSERWKLASSDIHESSEERKSNER